MWPYFGPPWTFSHQIWALEVFHHALPIYCIPNAETQKKVCDVITWVLYIHFLSSSSASSWFKPIKNHTSGCRNKDNSLSTLNHVKHKNLSVFRLFKGILQYLLIRSTLNLGKNAFVKVVIHIYILMYPKRFS